MSEFSRWGVMRPPCAPAQHHALAWRDAGWRHTAKVDLGDVLGSDAVASATPGRFWVPQVAHVLWHYTEDTRALVRRTQGEPALVPLILTLYALGGREAVDAYARRLP